MVEGGGRSHQMGGIQGRFDICGNKLFGNIVSVWI